MRRGTPISSFIGLLLILTLMYRAEPTLLQTNALAQLLAVFAAVFGATAVVEQNRGGRSLMTAITIVAGLGIATVVIVGGFMWYNTGTTTNVYSQR